MRLVMLFELVVRLLAWMKPPGPSLMVAPGPLAVILAAEEIQGPERVTAPALLSIPLPAALRPVTSSAPLLFKVTSPAALIALNTDTWFGPVRLVLPPEVVVSVFAMTKPAPAMVPSVFNRTSGAMIPVLSVMPGPLAVMLLVPPEFHGPISVSGPLLLNVALPPAIRPVTVSAPLLFNVTSPVALMALSDATWLGPVSIVLPLEVVVSMFATMEPPRPSVIAPPLAFSTTSAEVTGASNVMSDAAVMVVTPDAAQGPLSVTFPTLLNVALPPALRLVTVSAPVLVRLKSPPLKPLKL